MSGKTFLGLDIGGTKCAVIIGRQPDGSPAGRAGDAGAKPEILERRVFATKEAGSPEQTVAKLTAAARVLSAGLPPAERPLGVGIACGSPLDSRRGLILSPPNLPGWDDFPIVGLVEDGAGHPGLAA